MNIGNVWALPEVKLVTTKSSIERLKASSPAATIPGRMSGKVTFPLILPGIVAAALLAFSLSIDDFVVTNFTSGNAQTFPMFIYAKNRVGVPVQVNVIGTIIFVVAVGAVLLTTLRARRRG